MKFEWLALGLDGEYLYSFTSSMGALSCPFDQLRNHLVVQEGSKSLDRIEN